MTVFETPRLIARLLHHTDVDALHTICGDAAVMRFVGDLQPYTYDQTRQVITEAQHSYEQYGFGPLAFIAKASGQLIGYGGLELLPVREGPELFYIFAPAYWGQGYATEVAAAIVEYGFNRCGLPAIGASFDPANQVSMRVAEKIGMHYLRDGVDEYDLPTVFYLIHRPAPAAET
ncbi:MAG TPA: GNAT family N-acetyltransferase [Anaerolineae bacterium]|nr:GNAT family N-acetyltransferase [Anaerolineae bacterium]HMR67844.1 GNAT family N-acetyltransferase [Anaerolineae bacterium]